MVLAALSVLAISSPGIAQKYTLTPVGSLGGTSNGFISQPFGINKAGAVVGIGYDVNLNQQAFVYSSSGGSQMLPPLDPTVAPQSTYATAINANGAVVGVSPTTGSGNNAVVWPNGAASGPTELGSACFGFFGPFPSDSRAYAVNSNGDAAGTTLAADCGSATTDEHAALFSHNTVSDLGTLGGTISEAFGINDSGVIVGYSFFDPSNTAHAFSWNGSMHDLGTFSGGLWSYAYAINASGVIVGYADTPGVSNGHAFMVSPGGTLQDLTPGSAFWSQASAINTSGQIVGRMGTQTGGVVPFLYSNGTTTDLNTMIDPSDPLAPYVTLTATYGYGLLVPVSINDGGQIVTMGTDSRTGVQQAYLLTPESGTSGVTLSQTSLSFAGQPRFTASATQTITLTSSGSADLTISGITASAGFTVTTNCPLKPATLAAGAPCTINVASSPTSAGPYTGKITIVDDAPDSPQTVALSGTGTDFSLKLTPGKKNATYNLSVTPLFGFTGSLNFACSGSPIQVTCSGLSPTTLNGVNAVSESFTVSTPKTKGNTQTTTMLTVVAGLPGTILSESATATVNVK